MPTSLKISEDNLLQLKSIQDQIQQLRVENAKQAAADPTYAGSHARGGGLMNLGIHLQQNGSNSSAARLSTSCPSLNNSPTRTGGMAMGMGFSGTNNSQANNNYESSQLNSSFDMNSNYNSQSETNQSLNIPGHTNRRRKNNDLTNPVGAVPPVVPGTKGHRKRQGHHRQRR